MDPSFVHAVLAAKAAFAAQTHLSPDACHVHVGMAVFCVVAGVTRRAGHLLPAWMAVLLVAAAGEWVDRQDDMARLGAWRWWESLHDVVHMLLWPTVLLAGDRLHRLHQARRSARWR